MKKIKVLVVDDSALIRSIITKILSSDQSIEVVGTAQDPYDAREKIKQLNPDVLTLDIEMPRMDGLTFLENLMRLHPMPVVMVSTLTEKGAEATMRALSIGAVDFLPKPKTDVEHGLNEYAEDLIDKIKAAKATNLNALASDKKITNLNNSSNSKVHQPEPMACHTKVKLVAIGSSTGGTEALASLLRDIPTDFPGIVITQHIPPKFSHAFAERLNRTCAITANEAKDGQIIEAGHVYIAPGEHHLRVEKANHNYVCRVFAGERVNRHCPSVEVLFKSVAKNVGSKIISVMLTGMGKDGATAMQELHKLGAFTIAQDEQSSVVWGMPGAAVKLGCVDKVLPLSKIPSELVSLCRDNSISAHKRIAQA